MTPIKRRTFLKNTAAFGAGFFSIVPKHVMGEPGLTPPGKQSTNAIIGVGMGTGQANSIYLTNLETCEPSSAISSEWIKNCWRAVPYETMNGLKGQMLMAIVDINPPPICYPLNLKGWYRIYLGLGCKTCPGGIDGAPTIKVKLTNDPAYTLLTAPGTHWWMAFREFCWKDADLTGQSLYIAKPKGVHNGGPMPTNSYIAYIRLDPLSNEEVERIKLDRDDLESKRLIGTEDCYSAIALYNPTTIEELYEQILPYQYSDVRTVFYNASNGDCVSYPSTKVGTAPHLSGEPIYPLWIDRAFYESMEIFRAKGIDPLGCLCDFAHQIGLEFHATVRTGSFICEAPWDKVFLSEYYRNHPEFHCCDKDGRLIPRLSYAFPEVQQHMLDLYCEIAERNIDGFGFIFIRGLPVVLYEKPFCDGFIRKYGKDPRELPEDDEQVCAYRASIFTDFLRKVKRTLNELRTKQGRPPLKLSAIVPATRAVNHRLGLDLRIWAQEKLINIIAADWSIQDRNSPHQESPDNVELDFFLEVVKGTDCLLAPRLYQPLYGQQGIQRMAKLYARGVNSGLIWDTGRYYTNMHMWGLVRQCGHKERIVQWAQKGVMPAPPMIELKTLGGLVMDKFPGNLAY